MRVFRSPVLRSSQLPAPGFSLPGAGPRPAVPGQEGGAINTRHQKYFVVIGPNPDVFGAEETVTVEWCDTTHHSEKARHREHALQLLQSRSVDGATLVVVVDVCGAGCWLRAWAPGGYPVIIPEWLRDHIWDVMTG